VDEIVRLGLKKWPNVPDCFGWLSLDGRGRWRIGEAREVITHRATIAFIGRNYLSDERGRWLFQNGPQRVYVDLEYTPWIWILTARETDWSLADHTGVLATRLDQVCIDDEGRFLIVCGDRVGVLHDHDTARFLDRVQGPSGGRPDDEELTVALEAYEKGQDGRLHLAWPEQDGLIPIGGIARSTAASRFGFVAHPDPKV
jgi:hypothetical protein